MLKLQKCLPFVILLFCLTEGCATLSPPDIYVFEDLQEHIALDQESHLILTPSPACMEKIQENACGHGVSIVTGKEIFIGENAQHLYLGKTWSVLKSESVYMPAKESYAPLSEYLINVCAKMGCNSAIDAFRVKLDSLSAILPKL